jgi:hypothetical protein
VIHLTSIPPAYARFPSQVVHDLGLQSSDVIISMASFSQHDPQNYLKRIHRSLRGQNAYFPEGRWRTIIHSLLLLDIPYCLSRFLTPSSPAYQDIRENGMIQGRSFPLNGLSGSSPKTVKKQKRFLPSPEELKTGRKGHKLVILFASELPCWADSIGDYEEQKEGWKKLAEITPGVYYFEFNWGSPSQLVEVMRKVV